MAICIMSAVTSLISSTCGLYEAYDGHTYWLRHALKTAFYTAGSATHRSWSTCQPHADDRWTANRFPHRQPPPSKCRSLRFLPASSTALSHPGPSLPPPPSCSAAVISEQGRLEEAQLRTDGGGRSQSNDFF